LVKLVNAIRRGSYDLAMTRFREVPPVSGDKSNDLSADVAATLNHVEHDGGLRFSKVLEFWNWWHEVLALPGETWH
jgi:hypothetical protein